MRVCLRSLLFAMALSLTFVLEAGSPRRVGVIMRNSSTRRSLDAQIPSVRERLEAMFASLECFTLVSLPDLEKAEVSPNLLRAFKCDYLVVGSVVSASSLKRTIGSSPATVNSLRMTLKVLDANGNGIDALPFWERKIPVLGEASDVDVSFDMLFEKWIHDVKLAVQEKSSNWPEVLPPSSTEKPVVSSVQNEPSVGAENVAPVKAVTFLVTTTIDQPVDEYASRTKGVNGEILVEVRKIVGGAVVKIDGVTEGSCPGTFTASPGIHRIEVIRPWMKPYVDESFRVREGMRPFVVPLEMSEDGIRKWGTVEKLQADLAKRYATAAWQRGIKINVDTANWRDVGDGRVNLPDSK